MTLEEDATQLLATWDERLRNIDENLIALEAEPTYQMLSGAARSTLEGVTRERVVPALDALAELFEHRSTLGDVLARARELEKGAGFWDKDDKLREVVRLLDGPSIRLASRPTPLLQRNLLDPAAREVAIGPRELLGQMARGYQVARDVVAEVAAAWARLEPRLEQAEHEVSSLMRQSKELGASAAAAEIDLAWIQKELSRIRGLVANDPLGVTGSFEVALAPRLAQVQKSLGQLHLQRARVETGLRDATALLVRVKDTRIEAEQARARALAEFTEALPTGVMEEAVLGLGPWQEKIAAAALAGRWHAADVGLTRWFDAARALLVQARAVLSATSGAFEKRDELAGRLSSRMAQTGALEARGVRAGAGVLALAEEAERMLRASPIDLTEATRAVDAYEAEVVALAARAR